MQDPDTHVLLSKQKGSCVAQIEGFRVQNYRSLRDVTLGRLLRSQDADPLTPLTAVIGTNGAGKSTLFDAFGFLADCLMIGVEAACDREHRGGFGRLRSMGASQPIGFELYYREGPNEPSISYELEIDVNETGPFVASETLESREHSTLTLLRRLSRVADNFVLVESRVSNHDRRWAGKVALTDPHQLAIAALGMLGDHPDISNFRNFIKGWYLSYFTPDAARRLPAAGPQRHLNAHGDNLGNVVQFMRQEYPDRFASILQRIAERIPGLTNIDTKVTEDKRVLLRFNDAGFSDPFYAQQMSDGTLKVFAYLLLLEDPDPPPFICIEEPENGLYHKLLDTLAQEFRAHATGKKNAPQIFVTTHQPYFVDALAPEEVWILAKGPDGFSTIRRVSDLAIVKNMVAEGLPLGGLWYSDYLDQR